MWTVLAAACVCPRGLAAVRRRARAFHDAGGSLDRLIARNDREGAFDELAVALWLVQLALGIAHMHAHGVIHRDLKARRPRRAAPRHASTRARKAAAALTAPVARAQPANIFMSRSGVLKIGDLGGCRLVARPEESPCGGAYGSPLYLCPEVWCLRACTEKSDVWSLGCVVYELMALRPPFSAPELAHKVLNASPQPLPAGCSVELRDLVGRMLEKDPERRISSGELLGWPYVQRHLARWMRVARAPPAGPARHHAVSGPASDDVGESRCVARTFLQAGVYT